MFRNQPATEVHHANGRAGTLLIDERFWKPLCSSAHRYVTEHPKYAREDGLTCPFGMWNKPPQDEITRVLKDKIRELTK